jgi:hypothetical protein
MLLLLTVTAYCCSLLPLHTKYGRLKLCLVKVYREISAKYVRLFFDLYMVTIACFFLAWFYSHWDPNVRRCMPSSGEENYFPTHGA